MFLCGAHPLTWDSIPAKLVSREPCQSSFLLCSFLNGLNRFSSTGLFTLNICNETFKNQTTVFDKQIKPYEFRLINIAGNVLFTMQLNNNGPNVTLPVEALTSVWVVLFYCDLCINLSLKFCSRLISTQTLGVLISLFAIVCFWLSKLFTIIKVNLKNIFLSKTFTDYFIGYFLKLRTSWIQKGSICN